MKEQKIFFGSNLKFLRERRKISQEELAKNLNVTRAKLGALETGHTKSPQPEDYINVSNYFKISIDSLLKVDLSKLGELKLRELEAGNDIYVKGGNLRVLAITVDKSNNEQTEYVPIKAKAGYAGGGYSDPEYISELPKFSLPNMPKGTFRIFPISGDSMLPIPDGSDITGQFVEDWSTIKPETPAIVILKAQDFVFKLVTFQQDGHILLQSLNSSYAPYMVEAEDVLEIWKFYAYTSRDMPDVATDLNMIIREIRELKGTLGK
ncbi:Transcriptional regulator, XRE family [Sphingobacterium sp. PM2-P1-29]|nr:Transcriptional regulator, XRE family [Sphingobacterium sp. PM2-P1-29]